MSRHSRHLTAGQHGVFNFTLLLSLVIILSFIIVSNLQSISTVSSADAQESEEFMDPYLEELDNFTDLDEGFFYSE